MNKLDEQYQNLIYDILEFGTDKKDRTGTGTISTFGKQIRHDMSEGFPLLTTKKMAIKTMMTELKWFLKGDTNIKFLVDNGCNIWNGDSYKSYAAKTSMDIDGQLTQEEFINKIKTDDEFAKKWGELGPVYGKQWRNWGSYKDRVEFVDNGKDRIIEATTSWPGLDQIQNLINELKTNPDSRRLMVNAWNVGELDQMTLPPCHFGFQVYTRELNLDERIDIHNKTKVPGSHSTDYFHEHMDFYSIPKRTISLMWNQRSVDTFLGLPFNIASYGLLLEIIAKEANMIPDALIGNLGDVHLYSNHIEQAKEQIGRDSFDLPKLKMNPIFLANLEHRSFDEAINGQINFYLENYQSHSKIKAPLSN